MIPSIAEQMASSSKCQHEEAMYQVRRLSGRTKPTVYLDKLDPELAEKLKKGHIAERSYRRYKKAFEDGDKTVKQIMALFFARRQAISVQMSKLAHCGIVEAVGSIGKEVIWRWKESS